MVITQAEHIVDREPRVAGQTRTARVIAITAGKDGVGKTQIAVNLAVALADLRRRVLLVDADTGLGGAEMALGIDPESDLNTVISGEKTVEEIISNLPAGIGFVRAFRNREGQCGRDASAPASAANLAPWRLERLARQFAATASAYEFVLLDAPAAALDSPLLPMEPADVIVVTTPELAALADAYATVKAIEQRRRSTRVRVLVNKASGLEEAEVAYRAIAAVSRRFLGSAPGYAGYVPTDPAVSDACRRSTAFVREQADAPASAALRAVAAALCRAAAHQ